MIRNIEMKKGHLNTVGDKKEKGKKSRGKRVKKEKKKKQQREYREIVGLVTKK
jgi:hypothetical protein